MFQQKSRRACNAFDNRCIARRSISAGWNPPTHRKRWTLGWSYETTTFQQCSNHRVLIYIYNRLIILFTKGSLHLAMPVRQIKHHRWRSRNNNTLQPWYPKSNQLRTAYQRRPSTELVGDEKIAFMVARTSRSLPQLLVTSVRRTPNI